MITRCRCGGAQIEVTQDHKGPVHCGENQCLVGYEDLADQIRRGHAIQLTLNLGAPSISARADALLGT